MRYIGIAGRSIVLLTKMGGAWGVWVHAERIAVWSTKREAEAHAREIRRALKMRRVKK